MKILNLNISNLSESELLEKVFQKIKLNQKYLIHHINVHITITSQKNKELEKALNNFSELFYDGIGIYLASKFLFGKSGIKERMTGTDFYPKLLQLASENTLRVFFLGGSREAHDKLFEVINSSYKGVDITGQISNKEKISSAVLQNINTDILFVGLGSPKQEIWSSENFIDINSKLFICVGSGIDYLSGVYRRSPLFFQKYGLEWLWRLFYDPQRLWKRYIIGNFIFTLRIIFQKFGKKYA